MHCRLNELEEFLSELPSDTLVHFEMASFVNPHFLKRLTDVILPYSDSIGMNEQELPNLSSLIKSGDLFKTDRGHIFEVIDNIND